MQREKGSEGWGGLSLSGSFAALRMTAKAKEAKTKGEGRRGEGKGTNRERAKKVIFETLRVLGSF
jgi:hypothetical protein